ncbi:hypothetical protein, partial [Mesorhizobium sp.]|uniref:hypothetical protein n=1 Tax=Mesorhizobium sp. TaxID=1871066 RepID=UPI0025D02D9F
MQRAEVDREGRRTAAEIDLARRPAGVDAVRHLAVLGQPVGRVIGDDGNAQASRHAAMGVIARSHVGLGPCHRKRVNALPLGGKTVLEGHVMPLSPKATYVAGLHRVGTRTTEKSIERGSGALRVPGGG